MNSTSLLDWLQSKRLPKRTISVSLIVLLLLIVTAAAALAHPLGNFTTNRYSKLIVGDGSVQLLYIVDMAEVPAFREKNGLDRDGNGSVDAAESQTYLSEQADRLVKGLSLSVNSNSVPLSLIDQQIAFPAGQGGLDTLRMEFQLLAEPTVRGEWTIDYADNNFAGMLGWQEIVIQTDDTVDLVNTSVPQEDLSNELRTYPSELLENPPAVSSATAQIAPAGMASRTTSSLFTLSAEQQENSAQMASAFGSADPFADVITRTIDTPLALLLAMLAALVWGMAHALSPGHGKTIVAAYLVGSRGTAKHALFLGLTTTITHTLGVFALGLVTLFASRYILPDQLYPWLGMLSGLLVVWIGGAMAWQRIRPMIFQTPAVVHAYHTGGQEHVHDHAHDDDHEHHVHDHDHPHDHDHSHDHDHPHDHDHSHGPLVHSHGGHTHSHMPPGVDGEPITWRNLLALGVSGGLLPCPSALVVMLGSIALGRPGLGLLLIVVFSIGLASVLTAIGILMVYAGRFVKYVPEGGRLLKYAPIASALFITVAGVAITLQAFSQTGLFPS